MRSAEIIFEISIMSVKNSSSEIRVEEPRSPLSKPNHLQDLDTFKFRLKELANLFTMFPPALLCLLILNETWLAVDRYLLASCLGAVIHMPFAVGFHFASFLIPETPHFIWEKLDLTFVHAASVFNAYGLSRSDWFASLNLVVNSLFVIQSWMTLDPSWKRSRPRNYSIAVFLQSFPLLLYGLHGHFLWMLLWGSLGGLVYAAQFFGIWSHAVFHLTLTGWQFHLLQAALKIASPLA